MQDMGDNHGDDLLILQGLANKALQNTQTALGSFSILLPHNGLWPVHGSLPVARQDESMGGLCFLVGGA